MGRLYEKIRKDIELLRRMDEKINNKELVSMDEVFNLSVSLKKLEYVIVYAETEEPGLFNKEVRLPYGELTNFNLPENFEQLCDSWEDTLGEERVNHALAHLDRQDEAEPLIPEITPHNPNGYFEYVTGTIADIGSVSQAGRFGIGREGFVHMTASAHEDFVKTVFEQDYAFDPNNPRNENIFDFIDNPIEYSVTRSMDTLLLGERTARAGYLETQQEYYADVLRNSAHPNPSDEVKNYYPIARSLTPIHRAKWNVKDLSEALKSSVTDYMVKSQGKQGEPNIGTFLSHARGCVENTVLDHAIALGDDPDSKFLKDFLQNPVQTMETHYRELAADTRRLQKYSYRTFADRIHGEEANYNQAKVGKVDRFAQIEEGKKQRIESFFNEHNLNFNPATFKRRFQGNAFERLLGRTSKEWNDLADCIDSWQNPQQPRDYVHASDLADKYLRHKFPNVDPKDVTPEMCEGLRGAGKDRGLFCLTLVQGRAYAEERASQDIYEEANRRFDRLEGRLHRGAAFQDRLAEDIGHENDSIEASDDNEIVNDNVIKNDGVKI